MIRMTNDHRGLIFIIGIQIIMFDIYKDQDLNNNTLLSKTVPILD